MTSSSFSATAIEEVPESVPVQASVVRKLAGATSALSIATGLERGLSFLASLLAARIGGASTFGAYSLAITTANNISSYTGSGIGNTTTRFAGEHGPESAEYGTMLRAVTLVTCISAGLAAMLLIAGAAPVATVVLKNPALTGLLQCASLTAAAVILNEAARGFFIGQRNHRAVILLSLLAGSGLLATLPAFSLVSPSAMVAAQGSVALGAVVCCVMLARKLGLMPASPQTKSAALGPVVRRVWAFGLVQLVSLVSMNAAGWWLTSQIARADSSLVQVGLFAVSHQLRNMVALAPSLLSQSSYALMSRLSAGHSVATESEASPDGVMAVSTFGSTVLSTCLAGPVIIMLPMILPLVYGKAYSSALLPSILAITTAGIQMSSAPTAARLTLSSLRLTGIINTVWAIFVAASATLFIRDGEGATSAAAIYLLAYLLSSGLVVSSLSTRGIPGGVLPTISTGFGGLLSLCFLAFARALHPANTLVWSAAMCGCLGVAIAVLLGIGRKYRWLPETGVLLETLRSFQGSVTRTRVR